MKLILVYIASFKMTITALKNNLLYNEVSSIGTIRNWIYLLYFKFFWNIFRIAYRLSGHRKVFLEMGTP